MTHTYRDTHTRHTRHTHRRVKPFEIPEFGVTLLGVSHGFDKDGSTTGFVLWMNRRGVMVDPPPHASNFLERLCIPPSSIVGVILTHCHADHDAGTFQKLLPVFSVMSS